VKRGEDMKHVAFCEFEPKDFDKVIEKVAKVNAEREEFPERSPKILFEPHIMKGKFKGFTIVDVENAGQMANIMVRMIPEMKVKYVPLVEAQKLIKLRQKMKK